MGSREQKGTLGKGVTMSNKKNSGAEAPANQGDTTPVYHLVRKEKETGKISPRKAGRPHPAYEYGFLIGDSQDFHSGNPPKTNRKPGRPVGSKNSGLSLVRRSSAKTVSSTLADAVQAEVQARLKTAKAAAMDAFAKALGV